MTKAAAKSHRKMIEAGKDRARSRYDRHYHPSNPHHRKHVIADTVLSILLLALVALSAYLLFFYRQSLLKEKIDLVLTTSSESVISGDGLKLNIMLENNSDQALREAYLSFPTGTGFEVTGGVPPLQDGILSLGTIDRGEKIDVEVHGFILVDINSPLRLSAILNYRTGSFTGIQQKLVSEPVRVDGSTLDMQFEIEKSLVANQPFPFAITFQNHSDFTPMEAVTFIPNFPPGWEILQVNQELDDLSGGWTIQRLGSLEQGRIEGQARLSVTGLDEVQLSLRAFAAPSGKPLLQNELALDVPIRYPNVETDLTAGSGTASPGGTIQYSVSVKNNEEFPLRNLRLHLRVNSAVFNTQSYVLNDEGEFEFPFVTNLGPGQEHVARQNLVVRSKINPSLAFGNGPVRAQMAGEIHYQTPNGQEVVLPFQPVSTALNSDLGVLAFARYYSVEGDQIGRGPLPPKVGETTKYWVFLQVDNQLNQVENVSVRAVLAPGVDWSGRSSVTYGEGLRVNEATGEVIWTVGNVPSYKNQFGSERFGAAFEVAITPSSNDEGQILPLVRAIEVEGRDAVTGVILQSNAPAVSSFLSKDSFATDNGEVQL